MNVSVRELTASAPGGVAALVLEGSGARELAQRLARREIPLRTPVFARLARDGAPLDEIVVAALADDLVELHVHASVPLVRELRAWLADMYAVGSSMGESRLDQLVREAPCEAAARTWLDQRDGALAREVHELAGLDRAEIDRRLDGWIEAARHARFLQRRTRVLLAGPVNAGKSTLFNVLLGRERALTSSRAGTTRDLLREPAELEGWPIELWDGAGLREFEAAGVDDVERAGQALALEAAREADVVLWLEPVSDLRAAPRRAEFVVVRTQSDRAPSSALAGAISAVADPTGARRRVAELFRARLDLPASAWTPGRGVPWDDELLAAIREVRSRGASPAGVAARLARWIGERS